MAEQQNSAAEAPGAGDGLLQAIIDGTLDGIYAKDLAGRYVVVNQAGAAFVGSSVEKMQGAHFSSILPPDEASAVAAEDQAVLASGRPQLVENSSMSSGQKRWYQTTKTPYRDARGNVCGVVSISRDITERKQAELERARLYEAERQARAAAESAQQRATFLAAASTALASSLDYEKTLRTAARLAASAFANWCSIDLLSNGRLQRVAYAAADERLERALRELAEQYPIELHGSHLVAQVVRTGQAILLPALPADYIAQIARDSRHAEILRTLCIGSSLIVPMTTRGHIYGAISFVAAEPGRYDATDLALAEQIAHRASVAIDNARLYSQSENAVRQRDQFLSIASHELRTPLTAMVGYAGLLQRRLAEANCFDERDRRAVRTVVEQTARLARMVDTLFDISRIEKGQLTIVRAPLDLCKLVSQVAAQMRPLLKQHSLELSGDDCPLPVEGDELRLQQALQNLIQNAIKYSPRGGPIHLQVRAVGATASVSITDHGIGIPADALPHLFSRFYRAANAESWRIGGMGIGLYIVKEVVRLHGGEVRVVSQEGQGATFTLDLPLAGALPAARRPANDEAREPAAAPGDAENVRGDRA